ncbi:Capsular polysaccharide synthesis enzyme Cap5L [Staphylococcus aureus]|nr:hypothetical protein BVV32_01865 [Staphylococcus aureus]PNN78435.1 hypothetical protein RK92_008970 [Staphylococcus aureus]SQE98760.1 Capsular polysaccharide synthesis enzyme Cap5L [Staphylococcus aureus]SUK93558.1 Capsular polysaccharide synthesis enzyme Cap5L [Staphylococcus aureus]VDZ18892.1 Capsular polysaccharide synthesis enzyme Cap5L [Staphylococcus aureus]
MSEKKILILCQYFYPEYVSSATLPTQLAEDLIANHINVDGHMNIVIINRFLKPRCIVVFAFDVSSIRGLITKVRLEGSSISLVYFQNS